MTALLCDYISKYDAVSLFIFYGEFNGLPNIIQVIVELFGWLLSVLRASCSSPSMKLAVTGETWDPWQLHSLVHRNPPGIQSKKCIDSVVRGRVDGAVIASLCSSITTEDIASSIK